MTETDRRVEAALAALATARGPMTTVEMARAIGQTRAQVAPLMSRLARRGLVIGREMHDGRNTTSGSPARVWILP